MKKIIIASLVVFSSVIFAQDTNNNSYVYETATQEQDVEALDGDFPENPVDPAPIDDYIPFLMAVAVGIVVVFGKRKKTIDSF